MKNFLITLLFLTLTIATAHADSPMFRGDTKHSGHFDGNLQPPLSLEWSYDIGEKIVSSPAIVNGKLYIGSRDNHLYALDVSNGALQWKFAAENWIDSSPAVDEESVYFSSRDGHLYAVNIADGVQKWKKKTEGSDSSSPLAEDGAVFAGAGFPQQFIYALNSADGAELWRYETDQPVYSSPASVDDHVLIGSNDGNIYSLEKDSGELNWKFKTKGGINYASPAISDDQVFLAAGDRDWSIYAVNLSNGELNWEHALEDQQVTPNYVSSIAIGDDNIFFVSGYAQQHLYCLSASDGTLKWKTLLGPASRYGFSSSPAVTNGTVYVSSSKGILHALDINTGSSVWQYNLEGQVLSSVVIANQKLYIATLGGKILALK